MFTILLQLLWMQLFATNVFSTTLLEREKWQSNRRRRHFPVDGHPGPSSEHLHRVDGLDPFARHHVSEEQSWIQQGRSAFMGDGTCRPFADVRKSMEELHAGAKETLLELIAALGRMQAQTQLEKTTIDNLIEAQKISNGAQKGCEEQKAAAARNAEKYAKELRELQQIAQADAQIFNISQTSFTQKKASVGTVTASLLQRAVENRDLKRLGAEEEASLRPVDARPGIALADLHESQSADMAVGSTISKKLYNNVEQAAKELKDCLSVLQTKKRRLSAAPTDSPEKCESHKERLKKMFAAAYAHIARIKEKYEDLADDDSCDKAAAEQFGGQQKALKEELNATRRHLCSVHNTMTDLKQDATGLAAKANATNKLLEEMGSTPPECSGTGWPEYHHVVLELASLVEKHPACAKCCQEQSTNSLLQEREKSRIDESEAALLQEELPEENLAVEHVQLHASSHYWSL